MDRLGPRAVALAGFTTVTLATIPFALAGADTGNTWLMAALLVRGLGMGACTIPLTGAAYVGLSHQEIPHASILTRVTQQIGGSLGTAALAMILQHATAGARTRNALATGYDHTFWWSVAFSALATPLCLLLPHQAAPARKPASVDA
jgi:MFS family permease